MLLYIGNLVVCQDALMNYELIVGLEIYLSGSFSCNATLQFRVQSHSIHGITLLANKVREGSRISPLL